MTTILTMKAGTALVLATALFAVGILLTAPVLAHAASFAYVNQSGEVNSVTVETPNTAIQIAPNIHARSGVILLNSLVDIEIVGDNVFVK